MAKNNSHLSEVIQIFKKNYPLSEITHKKKKSQIFKTENNCPFLRVTQITNYQLSNEDNNLKFFATQKD